MYKYDHLRSLVRHLFFWACRFLDVSIYGIWLASACAVSYAWKAIWLADTCFASRKGTFFNSCCKQCMKRNATEPNGATKDDVTVNPDGSTHSNAKVWMLCHAWNCTDVITSSSHFLKAMHYSLQVSDGFMSTHLVFTRSIQIIITVNVYRI